ncbi:hypothetical protein C2S52_021603 [Perilla frutescens var. hirtella]|nr:hypothetical protein C2S52_021603 [Perilla frutescens var. hirtella]KAH6807965.1 hypothetical protein C2S51_029073 [Perilla frutescens var. frutescens]
MIPSQRNHWRFVFKPIGFLILLLQFFDSTGVGRSAKFTIVNRCSQPIWPVIQNRKSLEIAEYELPIGSSIGFQRPNGWFGRVWAKTGCIFNESGNASCATGDCVPQNVCNNTNRPYAITQAEFQLGSPAGSISVDLYDVSLVDGYNLPLLVNPIPSGGSSDSCDSTGCTYENLNQSCPPELRTKDGAACQGPCTVFGTPEYCCSSSSCGPTTFSQLFKKACPLAFSYPLDDVNATFTCRFATDYSISFCPSSNSFLAMPPAPAYPPQSFNNNPQERKGSDAGEKSAIEIITIVSVSISGVIIVFITVCCFLKRRHSHMGKCDQDVEDILLQHGSLAPKRYRYSEIKKITKSLSEQLGRGGYGSVYKGMLPDGRLVAVKILIATDSNGEEFINEVVSISRTSHVNIVTLLGFCYEGDKRALVYEFMPNKSLDKFLGKNGDCFLDLKKLYEIAVGVAKGLEYLHTGCTTRIVHFDIKPQNILLDEELCPKISDFGLAKLCKKKQSILSVMGTRGTIGYIAPEVFFKDFGGVSYKSDVYSYGMMLLEMAGAKEIVDNGASASAIQSSENNFPDKIYEQIIIDVVNNVDDSTTMEEEEEARKKMFIVGFWCIQTIPSERPSISKAVEMLEGSVESIQIPPKPVLFHRPLNPHQEPSSSSFSTHLHTENSPQH